MHCPFRIISSLGAFFIFCTLKVKSDLVVPNELSFSLRLIDVETNMSPIPALFLKKKTSVVIENLRWMTDDGVTKKIDNSFVHKKDDDSRIIYTTYINGGPVANGTIELSGTWNNNNTNGFLSSIDVGAFEVERAGINSIRVALYSVLNGDIIESSATLNVRSYRQWKAWIPIFLSFGLFLVFNLHMVHSLFVAIFVGSCIIEGSIISGFQAVLDTYLLQATTDSAHVSLLLFIVAISTLTTMVERAGGTSAVMKSLRHHSSKSRVAQLVVFMMGLFLFFDPFISITVVGKFLASIIGEFSISSEKFAFLVDTTAAPVASVFPRSTWLVFVGDLIQREIDRTANEEIRFESGYTMALSSIRYQFYPCLVLGLTLLLISTGRDMGPMLDVENQARFSCDSNDPKYEVGMETVKEKSWNWYIPAVILNVFLWFGFSQVGAEITGKNQDSAIFATTWLVGVVATIILVQIIFIVQKRNGKLPFPESCFDRQDRNRIAYLTDTFPSASGSSIPYNPSSNSEENNNYLNSLRNEVEESREIVKLNIGKAIDDPEEMPYRGCLKDAPLMNLQDGIECLVHGITNTAPITLSLIFSWATGSVYQALGVDRMVVSWILSESLSMEILPVTVFLAAFLLSLVIGSSWCSVSILIPGTLVPLIDSFGGDSNLLILSLASILSGAAAGDHIGPFSETTILSAIITGSDVRQHFFTQVPYALLVFILSLVVGTLPISYGGYPDYVGYIIGIAVLIVFVIFVCHQVERYQSSIPGQIDDQPITISLHPMITGRAGNTSEESSIISSKLEADSSDDILSEDIQLQQTTIEDFSLVQSLTQQGTEVVKRRKSKPSTQIQKKNHNLQSIKKKLQKINSKGGDPILGLVEDGLLPEDFKSELQKPPQREKLTKKKRRKAPAKLNKKRLIEATIKKAEQDGNMFSDSLRVFLRTAEQKLGNILDNNESLEISGSMSADSSGDDSLDNLMMDIAAKGWRTSINNLLGDDAESLTSTGEEYTTDGASTLLESDDSATATSSSIGDNGQSTYFTGNGDATSCASTATGQSEYSTGTSRLLDPLEFSKSRQTLQDEWGDNEEISSRPDDIFSATDYTKASF